MVTRKKLKVGGYNVNGKMKGRVRLDCDLRASRVNEKVPLVPKNGSVYMVNRAGTTVHIVFPSGDVFKVWAKGGETFSKSTTYMYNRVNQCLRDNIKNLPSVVLGT